jgi:acetolactate synthase-1/2/3 large subunit
VLLVVGLPGTQTLPLDRATAARDELTYVMAKHETAIPHVAWGHYESGGGVAATVTVPGPGDTNASHGLKNALDDSVPIVHISADSKPASLDKHPIHEIEPDTFENVVKANFTVDSPYRVLEIVAEAIKRATTPPRGPVRIGIPYDYLVSSVPVADVNVTTERISYDIDRPCEDAAELLESAQRPVVYVGGGARRSTDGQAAVRRLVERLNAPFLVSVKGQGVVPEDHQNYLGATGKTCQPVPTTLWRPQTSLSPSERTSMVPTPIIGGSRWGMI